MTEATPSSYWIASNALYINLNANGDPDYITGNTVSGAQILCYMKDIPGLGYDAGHNYRRWPLSCSPTYFTTESEKYVYVAIPRPSNRINVAYVVFPSEKLDIYGKNADEEQVGDTKYYYIFLQGVISATNAGRTQPRQWEIGRNIQTGTLSSDEAIDVGGENSWWRYSAVDDTVTFLKEIILGSSSIFQNLKARLFELAGHLLTGVADVDTPDSADDKILTPAVASSKYLSKTKQDSAEGHITFNDGVTVNGDADINGDADVLGDAVIGGKTTHLGKTQFGSTFAPGLTGFGGQIDNGAHAELRSLTLWEWLEVPELRYNRTEVVVGNVWRAPGGGIIESVEQTSATGGTITLKLEDGEIGKIAENDICMGIFHQYVSDDDDEQEVINDTEDSDDSKGNFHFSGFYTVYFTVTEITETDHNSQFKYEIRPASTVWPTQHHPCAQMTFVAYGNFSDTTRQSSRYSTLTYERYLRGVATWNFEEGNIAAQFGDLSNLSIHGLEMEGYSAYLDNIYMSGRLKQLNDALTQLSQYNVDFGAYVDVITVDDVGNVIGGLYKVDPDTQEKYDFRINSAIQVRKNGTLLTQVQSREDNTDGTFVVYAEPVGCTCEIKNGTIYITSISNVKDGVAGSGDDDDFDYDAMRLVRNCYVNLLFDCEGRTTFTKQFPVTIEHDSEPFVGANLSNEHSGVSWITRTQRYIGLPVTFDFEMWHNNEPLNIESVNNISLTSATQGVTLVNGTAPATPAATSIYYAKQIISVTKEGVTYKVARVHLTAMGADIPLIVNINVTCSAEYAGVSYERTLVHTITKTTDTNVYSLLPDPVPVDP